MKYFFIVFAVFMCLINLNAGDLEKFLAHDDVYGPAISNNIIIAVSFDGTPSITKGTVKYKEIQENAIAKNADIPLSDGENIAQYSQTVKGQNVRIYGLELTDMSEWAKVSHREPNTATAGKLIISAYSKKYTSGYTQIFHWECDKACLANFSVETADANFVIIGGTVEWSCRVKTLTGKADSKDISVKWDNSALSNSPQAKQSEQPEQTEQTGQTVQPDHAKQI